MEVPILGYQNDYSKAGVTRATSRRFGSSVVVEMPEDLSDAQTLEIIGHIEYQIGLAAQENRPISRNYLANYCAKELGIPKKNLFYVVDQYCDQNAAGVPGYLRTDVERPMLKVESIIFIVLVIVASLVGSVLITQGKKSWPAFATAFFFFCLALWSYFRSNSKSV